ncbi:MAG: hypothetical protein FWC57_00840, partial [Endomicrobia bacterium]|nr:hypothetical protein [Endomicrobiia bacterium]
MRKILFLSLALFATLASGAYGQQVAGTDPERNVSSGAILSVSGYSNPVFISSGTNGTTPYFIAVTGGGGVTLTNNSGGGQGV